ncbi:hypothetical protein ACFQZS_10030 [Mucilaginibacter calamicampi]|uniref:Uncharacterized protein n=1 Tax=Mucilaginibacter calamicampi TaxID=1302352 RepID=A0ABW2Z160_9SPHI
MNENTGNSKYGVFYDLLDNPADLAQSDAFNLQQLINEFPQSGLLRSMLAVKRDEEALQSASAYVNPKLLYVISNAFGSLRAVSAEQIVVRQALGEAQPVLPLPESVDLPNLDIDETNYFHIPIDADLVFIEDEKAEDVTSFDENQENENTGAETEGVESPAAVTDQSDEVDTEVVAESENEEAAENETEAAPPSEIDSEVAEENETDAAPSSENDAEVSDNEATNENDEEAGSGAPAEITDQPESSAERLTEEAESPEGLEQEAEQAEEESDVAQSFVQANESDANSDAVNDHHDAPPAEQTDNAEVEAEDAGTGSSPTPADQEIDDEVFEEIVSIEDIGLEQLAVIDKAAVEEEAEQEATHDLQKTEETAAGDSYFVFEPALPEDSETHAPANVTTQSEPVGKTHQNVSRYNDEKMPYSFMWWLDKTRKEHAAIYQPFATEGKFHTETVAAVEKPQPAADHLQQQYVENIFAVSAVVNDLNVIPPKTDAPPVETKADKIIEKFIHEEPQIKHPSTVKLDSENKAKKSSEDRDELVTETLAKIYTEQMLYHKAILTYKKLMLKFPEKSLYFAGQIEQLENKIN